jgi:hypothetical protein
MPSKVNGILAQLPTEGGLNAIKKPGYDGVAAHITKPPCGVVPDLIPNFEIWERLYGEAIDNVGKAEISGNLRSLIFLLLEADREQNKVPAGRGLN